jgi:hypothetical protein
MNPQKTGMAMDMDMSEGAIERKAPNPAKFGFQH